MSGFFPLNLIDLSASSVVASVAELPEFDEPLRILQSNRIANELANPINDTKRDTSRLNLVGAILRSADFADGPDSFDQNTSEQDGDRRKKDSGDKIHSSFTSRLSQILIRSGK